MLCILTPEDYFSNEHSLLEEIFSENNEIYIHIRKPNMNIDDMRVYLNNFSKKIKKRFILHSNHSLKDELGLLGVHLKEKDWRDKNIKSANSIAIHNLDDFSTKIKVNYMFLSPIFNSISKKNYNAKFLEDSLISTLKLTKQKVVALGGINSGNIKKTKSMEFSGIAVLGAVFNSKTPIKSFKEINKQWKENFY